jgi:hypothetical protein
MKAESFAARHPHPADETRAEYLFSASGTIFILAWDNAPGLRQKKLN